MTKQIRPNKQTKPSNALLREIGTALRANDPWLILRALHDEHLRAYNYDLARLFEHAIEYAGL